MALSLKHIENHRFHRKHRIIGYTKGRCGGIVMWYYICQKRFYIPYTIGQCGDVVMYRCGTKFIGMGLALLVPLKVYRALE